MRAVVLGERAGQLPVPDLLGALVIKSHAAAKDRTPTSDPSHRPERHREDLAVLHACAHDLSSLAGDMTKKDRKALRDAPEPLWHVLNPELRPQAQAAYRYLVDKREP